MEEPPPSRGPSTAPGPRWVLGGGGAVVPSLPAPRYPRPGAAAAPHKAEEAPAPSPQPQHGEGPCSPRCQQQLCWFETSPGKRSPKQPRKLGGGDCFAPPGRGGQNWSPPTALTPPRGACLVLTGPGHRPPELGGTAELRPPAPGGFFLFLFLLKDISSPAGPSGAVGSAQGGEVRGEVRGSTAQQPEGGQGAAGSPPGAPQGLPRPPSPGGRSQPAG